MSDNDNHSSSRFKLNLMPGVHTIKIVQHILDEVEARLPTRVIDKMTWDMAMNYFKKEAPQDVVVREGLIIKNIRPDGNHFVIQVFLDQQKKPLRKYNGGVYGRRFLVKSIDQRLMNSFGDYDMILVK